MKTKITLFIVAAAAVTLSFTFVKATNGGKEKINNTANQSEPAGGLAMEDR